MNKTEYMKQGIADNPTMPPKDLAEQLEVERKKQKLKDISEIKPSDISQLKTKMKKAGESKPNAKRTKVADQPANGNDFPFGANAPLSTLSLAALLVERIGKDKAKDLIDLA